MLRLLVLSKKLRKDLLYFHIDKCKEVLISNNLDYEKSKSILFERLEKIKQKYADMLPSGRRQDSHKV